MFFSDEFYFLSNMYPCEIHCEINNTHFIFKSVESAFQAHKCPERAKEFVPLDGYKAKQLGKRVKLRNDWDEIKINVMEDLLRIKFSNPRLMQKLSWIEGDIIEENTWYDTYWGCWRGQGQNKLGNLLMKIRDSKQPTVGKLI